MSRGRANKRGRSTKSPPFTPMFSAVVDSPAFEALTPLAQCLYWRLRRLARFDGSRNGEVFLSTRDAAALFRTHQDTARKAFYQLQAHGFLIPTQLGSLGISGEGRATLWRLTELPTPTDPRPTREFLAWAPGRDFPVQKGKAPPNRKQNPAPLRRAACPDGSGVRVIEDEDGEPACPDPSGVGAGWRAGPDLQARAYTDLPGGEGARVHLFPDRSDEREPRPAPIIPLPRKASRP